MNPPRVRRDDQDDPVILMLGAEWSRPGGLNRYFGELRTALSDGGRPPEAVAIGPADGPSPGARSVSSTSRPLAARLLAYTAEVRHAARRADLVDAHFALYTALPLAARAFRGRPLVMHFHGPWASESREQGQGAATFAAKTAVERWVYRRADHIIVLSAAFRQILVERYGIAPWRISVIPPGIDTERFTPGDGGERDRVGIPLDAWTVVTARRLVPRMGVDVLLRSWARLSADGEPGVLAIVGEGPSRGELETLATTLGIATSVRFTGRVDDDELRDWYRAADVSVTPSRSLEGFGLVVLEALACGTPVVVTDVGGLPEAVAGLPGDVVVPAGDDLALADRLRGGRDGRVPLPDPGTCREHAEGYDWDTAARAHRRLYASALSRPPRTRPRVVYLDHCAELSGAELALVRMLQALDGVDAHVVLAEDGPLVGRLREAGVSVEVLRMSEATRQVGRERVRPGRDVVTASLVSAAHAAALARRLRRLAPDVVHTNSLKAALYGGVAGRLARLPVVWHLHDRLAPDYMPEAAVRLMRWSAGRLPRAIIANSEATRATLPSRLPVEVIPCVIPANGGRTVRRPPANGSLRVGMVGRIAPWKGQDLFLRAFGRAFPDGSQHAVLVGAPLFGEDAFEHTLHGEVASLGLQARVTFRGFRRDVEAELAAMDVLVHSSVIPEPFGQTVLEGMAAGLPVVVPDVGAPAEFVIDGVNGLVYRVGDTESLALALRRLDADPALRARLGAAARETSRDFAPEKKRPRIEAVYRGIIAATHGRAA